MAGFNNSVKLVDIAHLAACLAHGAMHRCVFHGSSCVLIVLMVSDAFRIMDVRPFLAYCGFSYIIGLRCY